MLNQYACDRISALPDDILEYLTSKLTLRDAVTTKLLSSRWKHLAVSSRSELVFDWTNMFQTPQRSHLWETSVENFCGPFRAQFVKSVNQFLGSIQSSTTWTIQVFTVSFCLDEDYQDDIDKWTRFAIAKDAKNLALKLHCVKMCKHPCNQFRFLYKRNCVFPSMLRDCSASALNNLQLESCLPGPSLIDNQIFEGLSILHLSHVYLRDYEFSGMFSRLKKLKVLILIKCALPAAITTESLVVLERFSVSCSFGLQRITILNPKLVSFHYICYETPEVQFSGGAEVRNIEEFDFGTYERSPLHTVTSLRKDMPKLRHLSLYITTNHKWADGVTWARVTNLKMIFCYYCSTVDSSKIISTLKLFPQLRKLSIGNLSKVLLLDFEHDEHIHEHLEEIEIDGFYDTSNELQLLIYLLQNAPSLKQLVVNAVGYYHELVGNRVEWRMQPPMGTEERQEFCEKLKPFSRHLKIIFNSTIQ